MERCEKETQREERLQLRPPANKYVELSRYADSSALDDSGGSMSVGQQSGCCIDRRGAALSMDSTEGCD